MKLVVGLGNPGVEYKQNRHNIGFIIVDAFGKKRQLTAKKKKRYDYYEWKDTLFIKPKTYMNRSGSAVLSAMANHQIDDILILVDDLHLEFGQIRLRNAGGSGGHNGLKSIEAALGTSEFKRMRVGIGYPCTNHFAEYVLDDFSEKEKSCLAKICDFTDDLLVIFADSGFQQSIDYYSKNKMSYSKVFEDLRIE